MHEFSIAESLIDIVKAEMAKHNVTKLIKVKVKHGRLTQVVPEALEFAFEALTRDTPFDGAVLEMEEVPLRLVCRECGIEFSPEGDAIVLMVCPSCKAQFGHKILSGKELYIDHIEAE